MILLCLIAKAAIKEHHKFLGQFLAGPVPSCSMGTGDSADVVPENRVSPWAACEPVCSGPGQSWGGDLHPAAHFEDKYRPTYLPTYPPTYLHIYLHTYQHTYLLDVSLLAVFLVKAGEVACPLQHILRTNAASRTALEQQHFSPPTYWIDLSFKIILDIFDSSRTQVWRLDESCTSSCN